MHGKALIALLMHICRVLVYFCMLPHLNMFIYTTMVQACITRNKHSICTRTVEWWWFENNNSLGGTTVKYYDGFMFSTTKTKRIALNKIHHAVEYCTFGNVPELLDYWCHDSDGHKVTAASVNANATITNFTDGNHHTNPASHDDDHCDFDIVMTVFVAHGGYASLHVVLVLANPFLANSAVKN